MQNERHKQILEMLAARHFLTIDELCSALYISRATARRDLQYLADKGLIKRTHGGAAARGFSADTRIPIHVRENEQSLAKAEIGRQAASLVRDGQVILMDASTTSAGILPYLRARKELIVVTSGAKTALYLAGMAIKTYCTGGQMITESLSYIGADAERMVSGINADILFFSCRGLSLDGRLSDVSEEENNLRRVMLSRAKTKVLLCDSSKIGKLYFHNLCLIDDVDYIICERELPAPLRHKAYPG